VPKANPTVWADFTATMIRHHELDWAGPLRGEAIMPSSVAWASEPTGLVFSNLTVVGDKTLVDISHPPDDRRRDFEIRCKLMDSVGFTHETEPPIRMRMYPGGNYTGFVFIPPVTVEAPLLTLTLILFPPTIEPGAQTPAVEAPVLTLTLVLLMPAGESGASVEAPLRTLTLTLLDPTQGIVLNVDAPLLTLTLTLWPPSVNLVAPLQPDELDDFDYCDMVNGSSLQVWYDFNDLATMFLNRDDGVDGWSGSNPSIEGDKIGTMINKAYPVGDFPTRGEIASPPFTGGTMDLGYANVDRLGTLSAHDLNAGAEDFNAQAEWCFRGNDGGGQIAIIETRPSQLQAEWPGNQLTECVEASPAGQTRFIVLEVPGNTDAQGYQRAMSAQVSTFGHDIYWAGNQTSLGNTDYTIFVREFETGSHANVSDLYVPRAATPKWDILTSVTNNTSQRVTWYRNGVRLVTYVSEDITDNQQMRFFSAVNFSQRWENAIAAYVSYNRILTDVEINGLIKGFSVAHGVNVEGTVGAGGVLTVAPLRTLTLNIL